MIARKARDMKLLTCNGLSTWQAYSTTQKLTTGDDPQQANKRNEYPNNGGEKRDGDVQVYKSGNYY